MATFYFGERDGGRVLAYGDSITQVGDEFQLVLSTWDLTPAGEVGDVLFRSIDVSGTSSSGYHLGITPVVDGVVLPEQTFNSVAAGDFQCQAYIATRGTRCAARVRSIDRAGDLTLTNVQASFVVVRATP